MAAGGVGREYNAGKEIAVARRSVVGVHDWSGVEAGIFHDFHHAWIEEIKRTLNAGLLPDDYYALAEQHAAGFGPDVLALQARLEQADPSPHSGGDVALLAAPPKVQVTFETDMAYYRRKQSSVVVHHVSGDRIVAMVEVVSPGNKSTRHGIEAFLEKAATLLERRIHLLILDLHPPTRWAPRGIHGAIWEAISGQEFTPPSDKELTLAAYESGLSVRAHVEPIAVGDVLPDMPLFLEFGGHILVPLDATYQRAFEAVPRRWRSVIEQGR